jgi:hypothetical protein
MIPKGKDFLMGGKVASSVALARRRLGLYNAGCVARGVVGV